MEQWKTGGSSANETTKAVKHRRERNSTKLLCAVLSSPALKQFVHLRLTKNL